MDIKTIKVRSTDQAILFKKEFDATSRHATVTECYILTCDSYLFFKNGKLLGGCIYNGGVHPLRYFEIFTEEKLRTILLFENINYEDFLEITCIFKSIKSEMNKFEKVIFYFMVLKYALISAKMWNKKYFLGGTLVKKILDLHLKIFDKILYKSPEYLPVIEKKEPNQVPTIYCTKTSGFIGRLFFALLKNVLN